MYPSGRWDGFWVQEHFGRQAMTPFSLRFADGIITGEGRDVIGRFTFAGEYNTADYAAGAEGDGFLLMGNYASGPFGITLRYQDYKIKDGFGATTLKSKGFTISPSYKASDNLLLVAEFRTDDVKVGGVDSTQFALEALFTF